MESMKALSPVGFLSLSWEQKGFERLLAMNPDFIGVDAGSIDPGPAYVAAPYGLASPINIEMDLEILLCAARERNIPLLVGSACGIGNNAQLGMTVGITKRLARKHGLRFRLATIEAEVSKDFLKEKVRQGKVMQMEERFLAPLDEQAVSRSAKIVGQMGVEPYIEALRQGADVILAGRSCDDAIFAAPAIAAGFDPGLSWHMGKILECAGAAALCKGTKRLSASMLCTIYEDYFLCEPGPEQWVATPQSIAMHTLYERYDLKAGAPGGVNDMTTATFEAVNDRVVKVSNSRWIPDERYLVKLEGVEEVGMRSISIGGIRDPFLLSYYLNDVLDHIESQALDQFAWVGEPGKDLYLNLRVYGRDGVLGELEPEPKPGHEVGVLIEAIAPTQELAKAICNFVRGNLMHAMFPGIKATQGNLAIPLSPFVFDVGPAYRQHIYHLVELDDPLECFPIRIEEVG
jgi:hypothetical protein